MDEQQRRELKRAAVRILLQQLMPENLVDQRFESCLLHLQPAATALAICRLRSARAAGKQASCTVSSHNALQPAVQSEFHVALQISLRSLCGLDPQPSTCIPSYDFVNQSTPAGNSCSVCALPHTVSC